MIGLLRGFLHKKIFFDKYVIDLKKLFGGGKFLKRRKLDFPKTCFTEYKKRIKQTNKTTKHAY